MGKIRGVQKLIADAKHGLAFVIIIAGGIAISYLFPDVINVSASAAFLAATMVAIDWILKENKRQPPARKREEITGGQVEGGLDPKDILAWEFSYAQTTASEAMGDRHTMVNFYLIITGVVISAAVALFKPEKGPAGRLTVPAYSYVGTIMVWLVCVIGWLYFVKLIRLRQAWRDSAKTMNQIKEFYIRHAENLAAQELIEAFRWRPETLPAPEKKWTLFFCSAVLIALINSIAFVVGGILLNLGTFSQRNALLIIASLVIFGLTMFFFHILMYDEFLREEEG